MVSVLNNLIWICHCGAIIRLLQKKIVVPALIVLARNIEVCFSSALQPFPSQ